MISGNIQRQHCVEIAQDGAFVCVLEQIDILTISVERRIVFREIEEATMVGEVVGVDLVSRGTVFKLVVDREVRIDANGGGFWTKL